jgi:TonB family protein
MKNIILNSIFILILSSLFAFKIPSGPSTKSVERTIALKESNPNPQFPGGQMALLLFFANNIIYPEFARKNKITGKVILQFMVNTDGKVSDVIVVKGVGAGLDEEAVRVAYKMPLWIPAQENGKNVAAPYTLPVSFKLMEDE